MSAGDDFFKHLDKLGLTQADWHLLKDYLLDLSAGLSPEPPQHLQTHSVVLHAKSGNLDKAARMLVGSGNAWLALLKS